MTSNQAIKILILSACFPRVWSHVLHDYVFAQRTPIVASDERFQKAHRRASTRLGGSVLFKANSSRARRKNGEGLKRRRRKKKGKKREKEGKEKRGDRAASPGKLNVR